MEENTSLQGSLGVGYGEIGLYSPFQGLGTGQRINLMMRILISIRIYLLLLIAVGVFAVGVASIGANEIQLIRKERLEAVIDQYVRGAESRLWVAHYIIHDEAPAMNFLANLVERSRAGVDVKLIIDGIGPGPFLPISRKVFTILVSAGVEVRIFHSKMRHFHKLPKRMHEKIILSDDVAVIGSSSIWQPSFHCYLWEADAVLKGDVLFDIEEDFHSIWRSKALSAVKPSRKPVSITDIDGFILKYRHAEGVLDWSSAYRQSPPVAESNIRYVHDPPRKNRHEGSLAAMLELLDDASVSLDIVNPYFFPVKEVRCALRRAVARGIKVRVFTNSAQILASEFGMLGQKYQQSFRFFRESKIEVWELCYRDIMLHAKYVIIDSKTSYIGSFNFDPLGAYYNMENGVIVSETSNRHPFSDLLVAELEQVQSQSRLAFKGGEQKIERFYQANKFKHFVNWLILPLLGRYL